MASNTIRIRLAGIDAPEISHNGNPAQPFAEEARDFLAKLVKNKTLIVKLHSVDQYDRVVASVYIRQFWFFKKNLSLSLVENGLATVYRAQGAQYGGIKSALESAETQAK